MSRNHFYLHSSVAIEELTLESETASSRTKRGSKQFAEAHKVVNVSIGVIAILAAGEQKELLLQFLYE